MSMWKPFTEPARRVIVRAQETAQEFGHNGIDGDHIFIAIALSESAPVTQVLAEFGVTPERIAEVARGTLRRGDATLLEEMRFTPEAKRVIEAAFEEARKLQQHYLGTEHLLLAYVSVCGPKSALTAAFNLDPRKVREKLLALLPEWPRLAGALREQQTTEKTELTHLFAHIRSIDQPGAGSAVETGSERRLYYIDTEDLWKRLQSAAGRQDVTGTLLYAFLIAKREDKTSEEVLRDVLRRLQENFH